MNKSVFKCTISLIFFCGPALAQDEVAEFSPGNAILDTTIPFAADAREAEQALRGAYGWATFQEGVIEGIYFRFDPDGYARFSTTPRLDTDVFEVICTPKTTSCLGQKGALSIQLNDQGGLQLTLANISSGDNFFIVDDLTELSLPNIILQPLDNRLEGLFASGGELLVRHGATETLRIPLSGFSTVSTYLRWVASGQDDASFPYGWPVSVSKTVATTGDLPTQTSNQQPPARIEQAIAPEATVLSETLTNTQRIAELENQIAALLANKTEISSPPPADAEAVDETSKATPDIKELPAKPSEAEILSTRLNYLMTEIGLDSASALTLLQRTKPPQAPPVCPEVIGGNVADTATEPMEHLLQKFSRTAHSGIKTILTYFPRKITQP